MTTGKTIALTIQNFIGKVPFAVPYHSVFTRSEKTICHIWESSWVEGLYESPSVQARTEWCPSLPCLSPAFYSFFHLSKICEHQLTCQTPASSLIRRCAFRNCALAFPEPLPNFQVMSSTQRNWGSLLNPSQLLTQFVESYGICALARLGCPCQAVVEFKFRPKKIFFQGGQFQHWHCLELQRMMLIKNRLTLSWFYYCSVTSLYPTLCDPHGLQPAWLLCPWDYPGKDTGMGCHFLLYGFIIVFTFSRQGWPWLPAQRGLLHVSALDKYAWMFSARRRYNEQSADNFEINNCNKSR